MLDRIRGTVVPLHAIYNQHSFKNDQSFFKSSVYPIDLPDCHQMPEQA